MNNIILSCENLSMSYKNNVIFKDLSFQINEGDFFLILGKNGVGKSTLLKGLLDLKKISSGQIKKNFRICGYMSQEILIKKDFPSTIWEFVLSARSAYSKIFYSSKDKDIVKEKLKLLDLWELKDNSINSLSIGQRQRVLLARCLCVSDKIIFLDEPTNSLDINVRAMLYEVLRDLNKKGLTVVMISHDEEAFKYSKRSLILKKEPYIVENVFELYEKGEIKFD